MAAAAPIPELAPVINITFSLNDILPYIFVMEPFLELISKEYVYAYLYWNRGMHTAMISASDS